MPFLSSEYCLSDAVKVSLTSAAQEVADSIQIDPSVSERKAPVSKMFQDKADEWLANDIVEEKVAKYREQFDLADVERDADGKPTRIGTARFVKVVMDKLV